MNRLLIRSDYLSIRSDEHPRSFATALRKRRRRLVRGLPPIEQILRGSLIETYKRCGRPNCHCVDGPGHGPKRYLSNQSTGGRPAERLRAECRLRRRLPN